MKIYHYRRLLVLGLISVSVPCIGLLKDVQACSRVVFTSEDDSIVVTGRTMDWYEDIKSDLWFFPRGMKRNGGIGTNSLQWVSKYGSVITAGFDAVSTDGMNERGLVANMLYLAESDFGKRDETRPQLPWSMYVQYLLDNFATVAEAVAAMKPDLIQVVSSPIPGSSEHMPTLHFSISDASGDSAIFEYIDGKLVIHHGKQYKVMSNSPPYDQQMALNAYWKLVGGEHMLPGTCSGADRYVRASYYLKGMPNPNTHRRALAYLVSIMRNISEPFCETGSNKPNLSPTIWITAADQKRRIYYFESTSSLNIVWVSFDKFDFKQDAIVKKLNLVDNQEWTGDVSKKFIESKPFTFTSPDRH